MSRRPRSVVQRIRDQIGFSLVTLLVLFMVLRVLGVRSTVSGFVLSLVITIALNVGLSYIREHQASRPAPARKETRGGGDIRWRDDDDDRR